MANMNYCKFQNTLRDLEDCKRTLEQLLSEIWDSEDPAPLSDDELDAAKALCKTARDITSIFTEQREKGIDDLDDSDIDALLDEANEEAEEAKDYEDGRR